MKIPEKYTIIRKRHRRLKKPVKRTLAGLGILLLLILVFSVIRNIADKPKEAIYGQTRINKYKDLNLVHLRYARSNGIAPFRSDRAFESAIDDLVGDNQLVKITDSKYYVVEKLSHSFPYLVPDAKSLLKTIGERFQDKLKEKDMKIYLFKVTSLLRTNESQRNLRHTNSNASPNVSAHLYGTTFDITYRNLVRKSFFGGKKTVYDATAMRLLSETIGELQKERKLVVVTERKEACFHITVR